MQCKIFILDFNLNDDAIFMIRHRHGRKGFKRTCCGVFSFTKSQCGLFKPSSYALTEDGFASIIDVLKQQDWDVLKPSMCCSKFKPLVRKYINDQLQNNINNS